MKTLITILFIILVASNASNAQVFTLTYQDNTSTTQNDVIMGFVKGATDGLDPVLGEKEIPPMHPIKGAHAVTILDMDKNGSFSSAVDMFTYRDLRNTEPLRPSDTFWVQVCPWTAEKKRMTFSWQYPLGTGIDSIVIADMGEVAIRFVCDSKKSYTILPNDFGVGPITIENFKVIMYRSQNSVSVEEDSQQGISEHLFDVYSLQGIKMMSQISESDAKNYIRTLPAGMYILHSLHSTQSILQY